MQHQPPMGKLTPGAPVSSCFMDTRNSHMMDVGRAHLCRQLEPQGPAYEILHETGHLEFVGCYPAICMLSLSKPARGRPGGGGGFWQGKSGRKNVSTPPPNVGAL